MSRAFAVLAVVAILAAAAPVAAQRAMESTSPAPPPVHGEERGPVDGVYVSLRLEVEDKSSPHMGSPFLVAGLDNLVNLTVRNERDAWLNRTYDFNITGGEATPVSVDVSLAPRASAHYLVAVRPDGPGSVRVLADAPSETDSSERTGTTLDAWAVPAPSIRFLDPPPRPPLSDESGEYVYVDRHDNFGEDVAFVRVRPGEGVAPRVEIMNHFDTSLPGFKLEFVATRGGPGGTVPSPVDVAPLEPGETRIVELGDYVPMEASVGGGRYFGPGQSYRSWLTTTYQVGSTDVTVGAAAYDVDAGAVARVKPANALVEVVDGLVVDLLVPKNPVLGVPMRAKFNITNYGSQPTTADVTVRLHPPGGLYYEVQGPESISLSVSLDPGETEASTIPFTPRVTGRWSTELQIRSPEFGGYGTGGNGFTIPGRLVLLADNGGGTTFARMGEPVDVELTIVSAETISDAELRVATSSSNRRFDRSTTTGEVRPGLAHTLVETVADTTNLGTLRPGGRVDVALQIVSPASGRYTLVPYVLAEGFAFTSDFDLMSELAQDGQVAGQSAVTQWDIAVQPRAVDPSWALAPITLGLAVFVGTWTMRTRFVK